MAKINQIIRPGIHGPGVPIGRKTGVSTMASYSSSEVGAVTAKIIVITYTGTPLAYAAGHTVTVNGVSATIASGSVVGSTVRLVLTYSVDGLDVVTVACSGSSNIVNYTAQTVTNTTARLDSYGSLKVAFSNRWPGKLYTDAAKSVVCTDGTSIYTAESPWGNGNDLVQATSTRRPTFEADGSVIFDKDATVDYMDATLAADCNAQYTAVFVWNSSNNIESDFGGDGFLLGGTIFVCRQSNSACLGFYQVNMGWQNSAALDTTTGTWVVVYHSTVSGADQTITMYVGKVGTDLTLTSRKTATNTVYSNGGSTLYRIGARNTAGSYGFDGNMKESLFYPGGVSDISAFLTVMEARWL